MSDDNGAVKPLPVKRRRTFGGANGVWWIKRTPKKPSMDTPGSSKSSPVEATKQDSSPKQSPLNAGEIEWDEDLCRPIYRTKAPPAASTRSIVSDGNAEDESNESSSSLVDVSSPSPTSSKSSPKKVDSISKRLWINAPVKRNKSFGTRKRPYSLLLLEESTSLHSSTSSSPSASREDAEINASSTTLSFAEASSNGKPSSSNNKKPRRRRVLLKDEATLQKAKQFFEQLDAERLTVDYNAQSPLTSSSKVTRTSHKLNLQSPRIQSEYQAYAKASRESGVTPLCMRTFASSRRDFFRKRELFDGFLDD